jgi:hypothetical protein
MRQVYENLDAFMRDLGKDLAKKGDKSENGIARVPKPGSLSILTPYYYWTDGTVRDYKE